MLLRHIALIDDTGSIPVGILTQTCAALQKQALRDLAPIWDIQATVDYFPDVHSIPPGYWPITIMDDIPSMAEGFHKSRDGQPFSVILNDEAWQLTCSHEMCEMLIDPDGNRLIASDSIIPDGGRVNYLVEICDPCGGPQFAYSVNGIPMCDFYTPHYFDPVGSSGVQYSFTGAIRSPRDVLRGGYLTWIDPSDQKAYQANHFGPEIIIREIPNFARATGSLRSKADHLTSNATKKQMLKTFLKKNKIRLQKTLQAPSVHGKSIESEIKKIKSKYRRQKIKEIDFSK